MADLFAGISVSDYQSALDWYERLLGVPPAFFPNDAEAVWEVEEHRYVYVQLRPEHAGHALVTVFLADLQTFVDGASARGIEPALQETYDNGVRKITYRDADGNEFGVGGATGSPGTDR